MHDALFRSFLKAMALFLLIMGAIQILLQVLAVLLHRYGAQIDGWLTGTSAADLLLYVALGLAGFSLLTFVVVSAVFDIRRQRLQFEYEMARWRAARGEG